MSALRTQVLENSIIFIFYKMDSGFWTWSRYFDFDFKKIQTNFVE